MHGQSARLDSKKFDILNYSTKRGITTVYSLKKIEGSPSPPPLFLLEMKKERKEGETRSNTAIFVHHLSGVFPYIIVPLMET